MCKKDPIPVHIVNHERMKDTLQPKDRLIEMFKQQEILSRKFAEVERANGLGLCLAEGPPYDLNDPRFQYVIKDYAWRVIEELAEVLDAKIHTHRREELADVFHFFIELCLILEIGPLSLVNTEVKALDLMHDIDALDVLFGLGFTCWQAELGSVTKDFIQYFGMAMECLKNKPWKQTPVETDRETMRAYLQAASWSLAGICRCYGISAGDLYQAYIMKNKINEGRIEGGR